MPKNIVIFSDGTGKEGGRGHNSNVYKLFNMVEDRTAEQIAFYDRGLGTGWRKVTGRISGMGISKNIRDCYQFIFDNYATGDQIYLFGFSRGAATVRSLSGFVHLFGILPKSRPELIKQAYKIYKIRNHRNRLARARDFVKRHRTIWCRIKFLGVWDTVAALGIPIKSIDVAVDRIPWFRHKFHALSLSPSVENAVHALAIDDRRLTFHPVLWRPKLRRYQTMKQVWFCGVHTDVGGGYEEQGLSDIPLAWMAQAAFRCGLRIYPNHKVKINQAINAVMHDSLQGFPGRLYRERVRSWSPSPPSPPIIHESVEKRKLNPQNKTDPPYAPWIFRHACEIERWCKEVPVGAYDIGSQ